VRKNNNTSLPVSFKNRNLLGYKKSHLRFGDLGLKFDKNYTIEKLHLVVLKKKFKFFLKKKKKYLQKLGFLYLRISLFIERVKMLVWVRVKVFTREWHSG